MSNDKNILNAVHESISDLHEIGLVNDVTLREFNAHCLPDVKKYTARQIKAIRESNKVSQAVFAAYLNTSPETVKKWEARGVAVK